MFSTPTASYASRISPIWARVWLTHVRCAIGVTGVSLRIHATASWVRTRVPPPAP